MLVDIDRVGRVSVVVLHARRWASNHSAPLFPGKRSLGVPNTVFLLEIFHYYVLQLTLTQVDGVAPGLSSDKFRMSYLSLSLSLFHRTLATFYGSQLDQEDYRQPGLVPDRKFATDHF